jgi:mono/diheme cytochrome c family protein
MTTLLLVAALGQCSSQGGYSYGYSYQRPTYQQTYSYTPQVVYKSVPSYSYQAPAYSYQAPAVDYSLVGKYMREEAQYQAQVAQNAKIDALLTVLSKQPPPVQAPAPQPQPQFQAPYPTPQAPAKAPPVQQYEAPYPSEQQPPYATKPQPSVPPSPAPSFESSSWTPSRSYGAGAVDAMASVFRNRCAECHVGEATKGGGIKLLELDGTLALIDPYLDQIAPAVTSGRMPKKGPRLDGQELAAVLAGVQQYAATARNRANVVASFGQ